MHLCFVSFTIFKFYSKAVCISFRVSEGLQDKAANPRSSATPVRRQEADSQQRYAAGFVVIP